MREIEMRGMKIALIGAALTVVALAPASAADITVLRGNAAEIVRVSNAGPTILRGGGTMRVKPPKETAAVPARTAYAGKTLWLVAKNEPLVACFLVRTAYFGQRKIRCAKARQ
jgi:hypothetical protein